MTRKKRKQPETKYKARWGFRLSDADAQFLGEEVEKLKERTPEALLKSAKRKSSRIHHLFDWDEQSAAHKYRLWQARYYFSSYTIVTEEEVTRAVHSVQIGTLERGYEFHEKVLNCDQDKVELSKEFYALIKAQCLKARELGFHETSNEWAVIIETVLENPPDLRYLSKSA